MTYPPTAPLHFLNAPRGASVSPVPSSQFCKQFRKITARQKIRLTKMSSWRLIVWWLPRRRFLPACWVGVAVSGLIVLVLNLITQSDPCKLSCGVENWLHPPHPQSKLFIDHIIADVIEPQRDSVPYPLTVEEVHQTFRVDSSAFTVNQFLMGYLGDIVNGTFLEVGAGDGEFLSFSSALEVQLNWRGLLVEPREEDYVRLRQRRRAASAKACVTGRDYHGKELLWIPKVDESLSPLLQRSTRSKAALSSFVDADIMEQVSGSREQVSGSREQVSGSRQQVRMSGSREQVRMSGSREQVRMSGSREQVRMSGSREQDAIDGEERQVQCYTLSSLVTVYQSSINELNQPIDLLILDTNAGELLMMENLTYPRFRMILVRMAQAQLSLIMDNMAEKLDLHLVSSVTVSFGFALYMHSELVRELNITTDKPHS
ncbi:hypothetical protein FHG87_000013 [Trinorchestia longiramus]|nr:hypothetical protein FHG87_000013 [Trinorchestia longiramus]